MLEAAEIGRTESRAHYKQRLPGLRVELLNAQFDLREADFPTLVLVTGDDPLGCNAVVNLLHEWLDARYLHTHAFARPSDEERERPRFWRYWRALPGRGELALYVGAWPEAAIVDRARRKIGKSGFERRLEHIGRFEQMLVAEGARVLKLWLHLPKKELHKRLARARKDPDQHWRISETHADIYENWDRVMPLAERLLSRTSVGGARWQVIESTDARHRNLMVGEALLRHLREPPASPSTTASGPAGTAASSSEGGYGFLAATDLSTTLDEERYDKDLERQQRRIRKLSRRARQKEVSSVLVFEGWDAAGKGGAIRRITTALEATDYQVVPIAAPTEEERAHHYLWRFWRHLPRAGRMLIFDRSWYGRVLVERVEGLTSAAAWQRAYAEIRDFEEQLTEHGTPVVKFWLHIDPETQLERFRARATTPYKKYKLTEDDYRNRERWPDYTIAIEEMIARTSTEGAPWHVVPANDKRAARVRVLKAVCAALERVL